MEERWFSTGNAPSLYSPNIPTTLAPTLTFSATVHPTIWMMTASAPGYHHQSGHARRHYNLCIKLKNYDTNTLFAETCRSMFIARYEPPQIIGTAQQHEWNWKTPQYVNVTWSQVTPYVQGITYRPQKWSNCFRVSPYDAINYSTQVVPENRISKQQQFPIDLAME